jgi:hypothetical protein
MELLEFKKLDFFDTLLLCAFSIYLILGNIPRVINIGTINIIFPITEIILYVLSSIYFISRIKKINVYLLLCGVIFAVSFFSGTLKALNVLSMKEIIAAFFYLVRLYMIGITVITFGYLFAKKFVLNKLFSFYSRIFYMQLIFAGLIFLCFPNSVNLWNFLKQYNIEFVGDPHVSRLIGTIFDPNFFGALLTFPYTLALLKIVNGNKVTYRIYLNYFIFQFAILMTSSRSALLGMFIVVILVAVANLILLFQKHPKKNISLNIFPTFFLFVTNFLFLAIAFFTGLLDRIITRFTSMVYDPSAIHRLLSFQNAFQLLNDNYLTGIGYNYLQNYKHFTLGRQFDASVLNIWVTLGIPLGMIFTIIFLIFVKKSLKYYKKNDYLLYLFISIFTFTSFLMSFFNNLLFLPFYLIIICPLFFYGNYRNCNEECTRHTGKNDYC